MSIFSDIDDAIKKAAETTAKTVVEISTDTKDISEEIVDRAKDMSEQAVKNVSKDL